MGKLLLRCPSTLLSRISVAPHTYTIQRFAIPPQAASRSLGRDSGSTPYLRRTIIFAVLPEILYKP
jgi:hypothetical protein